MSAQFTRDSTHSKKGVHFSVVPPNTTCLTNLSYQVNVHIHVLLWTWLKCCHRKRRPDGLVELWLRTVPVHWCYSFSSSMGLPRHWETTGYLTGRPRLSSTTRSRARHTQSVVVSPCQRGGSPCHYGFRWNWHLCRWQPWSEISEGNWKQGKTSVGQYVSHTVRPLMTLLVLPTLTLMMVGDSIHEGLRSSTSDWSVGGGKENV